MLINGKRVNRKQGLTVNDVEWSWMHESQIPSFSPNWLFNTLESRSCKCMAVSEFLNRDNAWQRQKSFRLGKGIFEHRHRLHCFCQDDQRLEGLGPFFGAKLAGFQEGTPSNGERLLPRMTVNGSQIGLLPYQWNRSSCVGAVVGPHRTYK